MAGVDHILGPIEAERERRIEARVRQGAGAVERFEEVLAELPDDDRRLAVAAAFAFARSIDYRHGGLSAASYLAHPLRVAELTLGLVPDGPADTPVIALLHNVLEVGALSVGTLTAEFGSVVGESIAMLTVDRSRQWEAEYGRTYYARLDEGYRGARIVKVVDKLDNLFVLGLNPDDLVRDRYLDEIETCVLPMAARDLPVVSDYLRALIDDCRRTGYLAEAASRVAATEQAASGVQH